MTTAATKATKASKPAAAAQQQPTYVASKRPPRVQTDTRHNNYKCWQDVLGVLKAHPKGATLADVRAALPATNKAFAGYCVRRGWLVPTSK
jgi:hypothetical protein